MKQRLEITKRISAVIMLILLLLPIFSSIVHSFEDHDHPVCTEVTTHIHELEPECAVCDFHFQAFHFTPLEQIINNGAKGYIYPISHYDSIFTLNTLYTYPQRGPPQIQHDC